MKSIKFILSILISILFLVAVDIACIFIVNRPLFAIKINNGDSANIVYKGIFYDTYNCIEYSVPQIKNKFSKFECSIPIKDLEIKEIVDTTTEIDGFVCSSSLEKFYEDDKKEYFYSCIKSDYIIVRYTNGKEETTKEALKNGNIKISDLDLYGINYYSEDK